MKKTYIIPNTVVVKLKAIELLQSASANGAGFKSGSASKNYETLSREGFWDEEDEDY